MNGEPEAGEDLTPAQHAAARHLALLREDPPRPGMGLARRVLVTTRWQKAIRAPLRIVAMIAGSIRDALGIATRRRPPEAKR